MIVSSENASRDNLEFMQWIKRFWETNYPGHAYDPVARRKGAPMEVPATVAAIKTAPKVSAKLTPGTRTPVSGKFLPSSYPHPRPHSRTLDIAYEHPSGHRAGSAMGGQIVVLQNQLTEMRDQMEGLEKERDFYFSKVRFSLHLPYLSAFTFI